MVSSTLRKQKVPIASHYIVDCRFSDEEPLWKAEAGSETNWHWFSFWFSYGFSYERTDL